MLNSHSAPVLPVSDSANVLVQVLTLANIFPVRLRSRRYVCLRHAEQCIGVSDLIQCICMREIRSLLLLNHCSLPGREKLPLFRCSEIQNKTYKRKPQRARSSRLVAFIMKRLQLDYRLIGLWAGEVVHARIMDDDTDKVQALCASLQRLHILILSLGHELTLTALSGFAPPACATAPAK